MSVTQIPRCEIRGIEVVMTLTFRLQMTKIEFQIQGSAATLLP